MKEKKKANNVFFILIHPLLTPSHPLSFLSYILIFKISTVLLFKKPFSLVDGMATDAQGLKENEEGASHFHPISLADPLIPENTRQYGASRSGEDAGEIAAVKSLGER